MRMYTLQQEVVRRSAIHLAMQQLRSLCGSRDQEMNLKRILGASSMHIKTLPAEVYEEIPYSAQMVAKILGEVIFAALHTNDVWVNLHIARLADYGYEALGNQVAQLVPVRLSEYSSRPAYYMYQSMAQREAV